jgi:RHS repeat-associated protein
MMQTGYNYDCTPPYVYLCALTASRSTGKERDTESGLDYFGARYYGSNMGRFMSPDWASNPQAVPYASYANPQSLNLYNYMRNNPLSGTDPDGHCCESDFGSFYDHPGQIVAPGQPFDQQFGQVMHGTLEIGAAALAGPEVLAGAGSATTALQGLGVGVAALGVTGTAVNGTVDIMGAATHTNVDAGTNAVTSVTNPVAAAVSIATGSMEKGSQAADLATIVKAGVGAAQGNGVSNPAEVANSLQGAREAVAGVIGQARSIISGATAPTPPPPPAPRPPSPPPCSVAGACK